MKNIELHEVKKDQLESKFIKLDNGDVIIPYHGKIPVSMKKYLFKESFFPVLFFSIFGGTITNFLMLLLSRGIYDIPNYFWVFGVVFILYAIAGSMASRSINKEIVKPEEYYKIDPHNDNYHVYGKKTKYYL